MRLVANSKLGPYEIKSTLGVGGMGEVYRARDSRLNRDVAIKVLRENGASTVPTISETVIAAFRPLPLTSPRIRSADPTSCLSSCLIN
jgi:serine/threonine protein kinase